MSGIFNFTLYYITELMNDNLYQRICYCVYCTNDVITKLCHRK